MRQIPVSDTLGSVHKATAWPRASCFELSVTCASQTGLRRLAVVSTYLPGNALDVISNVGTWNPVGKQKAPLPEGPEAPKPTEKAPTPTD